MPLVAAESVAHLAGTVEEIHCAVGDEVKEMDVIAVCNCHSHACFLIVLSASFSDPCQLMSGYEWRACR